MAVIDTSLEKESSDRYLTYALSVVSGRALPDVRDGLKPVQRRILYAMHQNLGLRPGSSHRKSAAVVGEVLARFHPHGDIACYEAMVRMAQDFSLRYPLVDGQGNFGSLDGDSPAAYRYTETRLTEMALEVMGEIGEETVNFRDNFDATVQEPEVLPSRVPNLLINGAAGIAVGMATSIPPHNLRDTIKALLEVSKNPEVGIADLVSIIKGPDFPTGGTILNSKRELNEMYKSGRGVVRVRGEWELEEGKRGKRYIIITSVPYAVNKAQLVEKIANLIVEKKIPQLSDVRDESTDKVRVVLELAGEADPEVAMAYVFKHTPLESNFNINLTALVPGENGGLRPELLSLKACLQHFLDFREEVVERRLKFEKKTLLERIHILEGLVIIYDALDTALKIIRASSGRSDAADKLRKRFDLSEIQAFAVVDMHLHQLSRTNIEEIKDELKEKEARVKEIDAILKSPKRITQIVEKELSEIENKYGDNRRTKFSKGAEEVEFNEELYVVHEDVYAIVTTDGWIKRIRQNNELGSTRLREGDSIFKAHALSTLDSVAFITNFGNLYTLKAADFPSSSGYGDPIQKILKFKDGERIVDSFAVKGAEAPKKEATQEALPVQSAQSYLADGSKLLLVSKQGTGFVLIVEGLLGIKRSGKRAMKLREGDELAAASPLDKEAAMFTHQGSGLVIKTSEAPERDNAVVGIALMGVREDDRLVAAICFSGKAKFALKLDSGKTKEVESGEITAGHRGLKGTKVVSRDNIIAAARM